MKGHSWAAVLDKIGGEGIEGSDMTRKEAVARRLWSEAADGQSWAINALMDRIDGKPKQQIDQDITSNGEPVKSISPHQFLGEDKQ